MVSRLKLSISSCKEREKCFTRNSCWILCQYEPLQLIDVVPWPTPCSMGLRPKLAGEVLMPQRATKMLGIFSTGKKLFSRRTFMISCSSYVNVERQSYFFLFKYRILRKKQNGTPALKPQTCF